MWQGIILVSVEPIYGSLIFLEGWGYSIVVFYTVQDAPLTPLGREQSAALYKETKDTIQKTAELLASSPMRRAMSTALIGYADLKTRLDDEARPMVILPELQEVKLHIGL